MIRGLSRFKTVFENTIALTIVNGLNIIFPLIITPYLLNVIGKTEYGKWAFSQVFIQYGIVLISYGFQFSATKELSRDKSENKLRKLFYSVLFAKILIAITYTIFLISVIYTVPKLRAESTLFLFGIGIVWGQVFMPVWFFLGLEKMKFISMTNLLAKLVIAVLIFTLIKQSDNYIYVNLIYSIGSLFAGMISFGFAIYMFNIQYVPVNKNDIIEQYRNGKDVFISTFFINLYRNANTLILGFTASYDIVTFYSIAEKIIKALQAIINPLSQALFPHFSRRSSTISIDQFKTEIQKLSKYYFFILLFIAIVIVLFSSFGIRLYLGYEDVNIIRNLKIMSFVLLFGGINYLLGFVGLVNMEKEQDFKISIVICGLVNMILAIPISYFFKDTGLAFLMVLIELLLFLLLQKKIRNA